jgi:serine/threonine protein kinase
MANNLKNENEKFAIKQVMKGGVAKPEELIREANISKQLNNKYIIKYYEIFEDINFIYFVMELGDGGDLFDFITSGEQMCLSSDITIDLLIQILEAVDYLHSEKKIIHRDLKPENFLIKIDENNNPIIKIIDFGLSINMPNDGQKLTEVIGTRKYAAPEMILGYGYTEKIDEWAIGVVMFSMLTGYEPFRRTDVCPVEENIVGAKIDFEIIEDLDLRALNERLLDRFEISRITCKEALNYIKELKQIRDMVYNDDYLKYQRQIFIENYKYFIRQKIYENERKTI